MTEEEIMIRARAAFAEERREMGYLAVEVGDALDGRCDGMLSLKSALRALRDLTKPLSDIIPDPDLLEARDIVARDHERWPDSPWHLNQAERTRKGDLDKCHRVADTLAGIRRGRELERQP